MEIKSTVVHLKSSFELMICLLGLFAEGKDASYSQTPSSETDDVYFKYSYIHSG